MCYELAVYAVSILIKIINWQDLQSISQVVFFIIIPYVDFDHIMWSVELKANKHWLISDTQWPFYIQCKCIPPGIVRFGSLFQNFTSNTITKHGPRTWPCNTQCRSMVTALWKLLAFPLPGPLLYLINAGDIMGPHLYSLIKARDVIQRPLCSHILWWL